MRYRVVAVPIPEVYYNSNPYGRAEKMTKFDPKLVKKIVHSKLIACSTEIGIKNADKVSKELLIPAYLDAVENSDKTGASLSASVINMYNEIVTTLELNKEEEPTPEPVAVPATPPATEGLAPRKAPAPASKPIVVAPKPAAPKVEKPPKEKKVPTPATPKGYNRWTVLGEALVQMKSGKIGDLFALSNSLYVAQGGKDNIKEAVAVGKGGLSLLEKAQAIVVTGDSFARK